MNDKLKQAINELQFHIDKDWEEVLLIFDTQHDLEQYKKMRMEDMKRGFIPETYFDKIELISLEDLLNNNSLTGRRFCQYFFMSN